MEKKKICFIAQFPPPIHGLSKAVDTLYKSNLSEEFEFEKVDITKNKNILKSLAQIWKSKAHLFYFTISQTKGGNIRDILILKLLDLQKKKCLIHLHGGYYRELVDNKLPSWQRKVNYKVIKSLVGVIVLGPSLKTIFQGMIDDEKMFIVPNCVDQEFLISDTEFEEKIAALEHKKILNVLYLSNFIKSKGYPKVLEMAKLEKERVAIGGEKRFHFDFAGKFFEESDREFFERYIKENQLEEFITYHGVVEGQDKRNLLKRGDIFILLTNYPNEGQPISILEAMGSGMIIVTTNHAGIPDIVTNEQNGIVVSKDLNEQKKIYSMLYQSKIQLHKIAKKNRRECLLYYQENRYTDNIGEIFKKQFM
ncbi:glycosyltransferase family 4 protein [Priestia megaterium]|uniref:glycosyltransferase family 4 protein n=2 Tax=Bacteria TaxID=2 RepID=UPI0039AE9D25